MHRFMHLYEAVKTRMKYSCNNDKLPQTYGLYLNDELIGMYQFTLEDVFVRPDLYPWLACVYIDKSHRGNGYGRILMESITENAKKNLPYDKIYLYTKHVNLYEKYGWKFNELVNTYKLVEPIQRLYELKL